nr:hypothetical protein [Morchella crassipes]
MKKGVDLLFYLNFAWYSGKTCFPKIGKHAFINKWKLNKTERGEGGGVVILWLKWPPPFSSPPTPPTCYSRSMLEGGGAREGGGSFDFFHFQSPEYLPPLYEHPTPLFPINEKGGGFVVLLNIGGASLYQCMS